jgi:CheY-like chemotaxis protein
MISTETLLVDEAAGSRLGLKPGPYAAIKVTDSGTGIAAELRDRIFEPFFTTKSPGKGTGLGLATAYAIIKQHDGVLRFESQSNVGSCFSVYLPRSKAPESAGTEAIEQSLPAGRGAVLIAEDEDLVRVAVTKILEGAGYTVVGARDGLEALEILAADPAVQLVLLDVVMPRLGGLQTLARIRERWPRLKVILTSGYKDGAGVDAMPPDVHLLEKPYRAQDLLTLVHDQLSSAL